MADHTGPAAGRVAQFTKEDSDAKAKIEELSARITGDDRRLAVLDQVRNPSRDQRDEYANRMDDIARSRRQLTQLRASRASAQEHLDEEQAAAMPIRYLAELLEGFHVIDPGTDPEVIVRAIAMGILLSGDPLAIVILLTIGSRRKKRDRGGVFRANQLTGRN